MNHRHRKVLHGLFAHPVNANIAMKDVEAVIGELGGSVDDSHHGGRVGFTLNGHTAVFHGGGHALAKDEVQRIRKFLEEQGIDPARDFSL